MTPAFRDTFEAPLLLLREYSAGLRAPAHGVRIAGDLAALDRLARELDDRVRTAFASGALDGPPECRPPGHFKTLRHDFKNAAGRIVTLCELLTEDETDALTPDLAADLQTIRGTARRVIGMIDELGRDAPAATADAIAVPPRPPEPQPLPGRILFADDNPDNRELVGRLLERRGRHAVTSVPDGATALAALAAGSYDLLLLDVRMPGLNGFDVLTRVRANPEWRHLPVLMISAQGEDDDVIAGIAAGADDYVRRPFNPRLLLTRVAACLERKRLRDREVEYRQQIDRLFRAIFPADVADELREKGTLRPRLFPRVGILFLDVVGFTAWCERHRDDPGTVVARLQEMVSKLEAIARKHDVQKIKTIGDAFMATIGLTRPAADPVGPLVTCAREMVAALAAQSGGWKARVGVHVGPVMAGVIGDTQFQFDVWGSPVNFAARLQSAAAAGKVVLSADAWNSLDEKPPAAVRTAELAGIGRVTVHEIG